MVSTRGQLRGRLVAQHGGVQRVQRRGGADGADRVGPRGRAVGAEPQDPARGLLDPVVAPAEAEQVRGSGGAGRPGPDMIEVAEPRRHCAPREAAPPVACSDQCHQLGSRPVSGGRQGILEVEARPAARVARRVRHASRMPQSAAVSAVPVHAFSSVGQVAAQPGTPHEHRLGRAGALHLDEVLVEVGTRGALLGTGRAPVTWVGGQRLVCTREGSGSCRCGASSVGTGLPPTARACGTTRLGRAHDGIAGAGVGRER